MGAMREELAGDPLFADWRNLYRRSPDGCTGGVHAARVRHPPSRPLQRSPRRRNRDQVAGYLEQQKKSIAKLKAAEEVAIPAWLDYSPSAAFPRDAREAGAGAPATIGQASRIPGVTPAALDWCISRFACKGQSAGL